MTIVFTASEMVPFCKTGGLADVVGSLPLALARLGHEVAVILPGYLVIDREKFGFERIDIPLDTIPVGWHNKPAAVEKASYNGITVWLLDNEEYFSRSGLYGDENGDWPDNGERFIFFARGVVELIRALGLKPDVMHAHDWQAGLVMAYLATLYHEDPAFKGTATVFTIHNLGYQGLFPQESFPLTDIPREEFSWRKMEFWGKVSYLKSGIVYADAVTTVSGRYADEITREPLGFGLHGVLAERRNVLFGILNGIDQKEWNPTSDRALPARYSLKELSGKRMCRNALLDECGLNARADVPVFGMVTRLDSQKGLDILEESMGRLAAMDIRIVILGAGTAEHQDAMRELAGRYRDRLSVTIGFDGAFARRIYGGSDAFLMPSRYEPCGLGQLIAMRYGTLPVVHETGGLADTVRDLDKNPREGNGFSFREYSADALVDTVARAVKVFRASGRKRWEGARIRAMEGDYSWLASAKKYVDLYERFGNRKIR